MVEVKSIYKAELINKINSIEDKNILDEVNRLLGVNINESIYLTSKEQKSEIHTAQQQLRINTGIPSERADKDIDEWLSK